MLPVHAIPLSVSILWRFLMVLPFLAVFYVLLILVTMFASLNVALSIPIIGPVLMLIVVTAAAYIGLMHPYLIGIRIGLRALGTQPEPGQMRLLLASAGYGFVESIIGVVLLVIVTTAMLIVTQADLSWSAMIAVPQISDPVAALSREIARGTLLTYSAICAVAILALRAALLPTLAGAAAGRDPGRTHHTPFNRFGQDFILMMVVLSMIAALSAVIIPLLGVGLRSIGLSTLLTDQLTALVVMAKGDEDIAIDVGKTAHILGVIVIAVWLFSLQCAGAALSYRRAADAEPRAPSGTPQHRPEDIAALMRSRMPDQTG